MGAGVGDGVGAGAGNGGTIAGKNFHSPGFMGGSENWLGAGMGRPAERPAAASGAGFLREESPIKISVQAVGEELIRFTR
jgi:hypothetical protein